MNNRIKKALNKKRYSGCINSMLGKYAKTNKTSINRVFMDFIINHELPRPIESEPKPKKGKE